MIELVPCAEQHRWLLYEWRNSESVARFMYQDEPIARQTHDAWYTRLLADPDRWGFVIVDGGDAVGACFLADHDAAARRASFGLYVAEQAARGKGVGRAALCLLCEFAFGELGLHKLIGEALGSNSAAVSLYERLGFVREGLLRDQLVRDGSWVDVELMALFEDDLDALRAHAAQLRRQERIA